MLFNFQLRALPDVSPWGKPGDQKLHWFALTDGWYWLDMDEDNEIFRYTPELLAAWREQYPEHDHTLPYADYYVVRLWEDMLVIVGDILEPLPPTLAQILGTEVQVNTWVAHYFQWRRKIDLGDQDWDTFCQATGWWEDRQLDTGYLTAGPRLWFWNDGHSIHCCWDNTSLSIENAPTWQARKGHIHLTVAQFLAEVTSFHTRLIAAMDARIQEVKDSGLRPGISLDMVELEKEHQDRAQWLRRRLERAATKPANSWETVIDAIRTLEMRPDRPSNEPDEDSLEDDDKHA